MPILPFEGQESAVLLINNGKGKIAHSQPSRKKTKPARRIPSLDIHELPAAIPTLEQIRHAKTMHELAETITGGYDTYFHVIESFNRMTAGEFLKHFIEVKR